MGRGGLKPGRRQAENRWGGAGCRRHGLRPDVLKLIPFSAEHLRLGKPLPFGVRDAGGRLLLAAGASIVQQDQLQHLCMQPLYADED